MEACPKNCACVVSLKIPDLIDTVTEMETESNNINQLQSLIMLHTDLIIYKDNCLNNKLRSLRDVRKHLRAVTLDLKLPGNHPLSTTLKALGLPGSPNSIKSNQNS